MLWIPRGKTQRFASWNNKYGQYEKLKRGYNSKAADRDVRAAVKRLVERGWLALYPK